LRGAISWLAAAKAHAAAAVLPRHEELGHVVVGRRAGVAGAR
jgi:hypothetical protein